MSSPDAALALQEFLYRVVRCFAEERAAAIERACEDALVSGEYGVMVNGAQAWADPRVPYGRIWDVTYVKP